MSIFNDKSLKSVAEAASKIMQQEATHPKTEKEKDLAALGHPKDKITHKDVLIGRGVLKKEEKESCEDEVEEHEKKMHGKKGEVAKHEKEMHKEETEQLDELSLGTKIKAYANRSAREYEGEEGGRSSEKTYASIVKKHGDKAGDHADAAAHSATFGRKYTRGADSLSGGLRHGLNQSTTKAGKIPKATQSAMKNRMKEDTEQLQEYQSKDGVYKHKGTYGTEKGADYGDTDWDKENKDAKKLTKPASRKLGARQNYVRSTRVNESFTDMIAAYQEKGLKALAEMAPVEEEVDSETYETEMKDQKDKFDGKKKGGDVAKASVQAVKQEEVELDEAEKMKGEDPCWKDYEMVGMKMKNGKKVPNCVPKNEEYDVIDANDVNGVTIDTIEERSLTEPESKKKEEYVKGMKKKLSSFKDRYGDRAKEVMYATATKMAKKD